MKYEEAIERLQTIVADIERGETNVDELAESLKEAKSLIAFCKEKLQKVESDVKNVLED
ncbi:MAG: exodeoxyribonuclease VII small subunit [Bacteroidaceae bacterium]|nr:exodeoxyribonuclease VII small subunit [Bacteroidaceae bacterium]MBP5522696.1 exodeoxyribonuclease VII small subunit [Bacteroidaceae bacterium]MBQ4381018.1 exodeoxyribonuclease VII small subunit [Bacteroidaceae bacterium]